MENQPPLEVKKFDMVKDDKKLKLYFFIIQFGQVLINLTEDFHAIFSYSLEDAMQEVRKNYQAGIPILIKEKANVELERIVGALNLPEKLESVAAKVEVQVVPEEPKKKTAQDFIYGMMLICEDFVKDKEDQAHIKRILNNIAKDEPQGTDTKNEGAGHTQESAT